jgi:hypothetical protein
LEIVPVYRTDEAIPLLCRRKGEAFEEEGEGARSQD